MTQINETYTLSKNTDENKPHTSTLAHKMQEIWKKKSIFCHFVCAHHYEWNEKAALELCEPESTVEGKKLGKS